MPPDDEDLDGVLDENLRKEIREARKQRKELEETKARLDAADMRAAMAEAGVGTTGTAALFRDAYKGDADPEAIKAKAKEYGIDLAGAPPTTPPPPTTDPTIEDELQRLGRAQGATGAGTTPGPSVADKFFAELAAIPDDAKSSRDGQNQVMALVRKYQESNPEIGIFTKGSR